MSDAEYEQLYYCTSCRSLSGRDGSCRCGVALIFAGTPTIREQISESERQAATRRRMRWEGLSAVGIGGPGIGISLWLFWLLGERLGRASWWTEELFSWGLVGVIIFWLALGGFVGRKASQWLGPTGPANIEDAYAQLRRE